MQELYIDSVKELEVKDYYNKYDKHHINDINPLALINLDELAEAIYKKVNELKSQIKQDLGIPQEIMEDIELIESDEELKNLNRR